MSFIQQMFVEHLLEDADLGTEDVEWTGPTRPFLLWSPASKKKTDTKQIIT